MDLTFHEALAARYTSGPQKIKKLSEHWAGDQLYCPSCGHTEMSQYSNNKPVADFFCVECQADSVIDLIAVPKYFFVPVLIVKRNPLSPSARRAGWVGCKILLKGIPEAGQIFLIKNCTVEPKSKVLAKWQRTRFVQDQKDIASKGWLLSVMKCIEMVGKPEFSLNDIYQFEEELKSVYPSNRYVKEKMRQKLQILRDQGFLEFLGKGLYRLTPAI